MTVKNIADLINNMAPVSDACDWDNPGLLVGSMDWEVSKILVCLDITDDVISQAIEKQADLIVAHHPLIFKSMKRVTADDLVGRRILALLENKIAVYAMHTNYDIHGMGQLVASAMGLKDATTLMYEDTVANRAAMSFGQPFVPEGMGMVGNIDEEITLAEFGEMVKRTLLVSSVRLYGDLDKKVKRVAILPGSGGKEYIEAIAANADVYVTGDVSHHEALDAMAEGLCIVDAGHYGTEHAFTKFMQAFLIASSGLKVVAADEKEPFVVV